MSLIKSTSKFNMPFNSCGQTRQLSSPSTCKDAGCRYYPEMSMVRPRFFAGQLLTEDDLSLLSFYTVEKNRMHNRYLFGDGVVCGLEVVCHPCGDGRVIVQPGYALDCCGNDIYVPCPKELDINTMVHELRIHKLGGYDCGDPCEEKEKSEKSVSSSTTTREETKAEKMPHRRYCLYVRYCEQTADPVAPYQTDEPCGKVECEPTRIYEGFRFELDCEENIQTKHDLASQMCECLGDPSKYYRIMRDREILLKIIKEGQEAYLGLMEQRQITINENDISNFQKFTEAAVDLPDLTKKTDKDAIELVEKISLDKINNAISIIPKVIAALKKIQIDHKILPDIKKDKDKQDVINDAINSIKTKIKPLMKFLPPNLEEDFAIFKSAIEKIPEEDILPLNDLKMVTAGTIDKLKALGGLWLYGANYSIIYAVLARIHQFIVCKLDQATFLTDCTLRNRVNEINIPSYREGKADDAAKIPNLPSIASSLVYALDRLFEECFCHALNPPCTPCEDQRVLLACLEVKNCKVVEICNMKRSYVISPTAVRYWFPWIREIGEVLEKACCEPPLCQEEKDVEKVREKWSIKDQAPFLASALSFIMKNPLSPENLAKLFYFTICRSRMKDKMPLDDMGRIFSQYFFKKHLDEGQMQNKIKELAAQIKDLKRPVKPKTTTAKRSTSKKPASTSRKASPAKKT